MSANDPIEMRPEEKQAWQYVIRTKLQQALEAAPSAGEFVLEMGREYIRLGAESRILENYPDSALAEVIRELQEQGFDPAAESEDV